MKCPHCGTKNPIRQVYCSSCGKKMQVSFEEIAGSVEVDTVEDKYSHRARGLLAVAVLAVMAGVGVWLVSSRIDPRARTEGALVPAAPPPAFPVPPAKAPELPPVPGSPDAISLPLPTLAEPLAMRLGCRRDPVRKSLHEALGGDPKALEAIARGLGCLSAHQNSRSGGWKVTGSWEGGRLDWGEVGVTGLAVLALLGDGRVWTVSQDRLSRAAELGVNFLLASQAKSGRIGPAEGNYMYNHGIATTALADAYAVSGLAGLREPTERALRFLLSAQRASGGWDYTERPGTRADISVTAWQVAALRAAGLAGLKVPDKALAAAAKFMEALTSPRTAETGYETRPGRTRRIEHPTLGPTAISLACRMALSSDPSSAKVLRQASILLRPENLPRWKPGWAKADRASRSETHVYYYWYHGSMGMRGMGGGKWKTWNEAVTKALLAAQKKDGSWPRIGIYARDGGTVYATALAVLTLETTYRFP